MKTIIFCVFLFLIFYFVWRVIKKSFFFKMYKSVDDFRRNQNHQHTRNKSRNTSSSNKKFKKDIKWDAETVDFEEVPEQNSEK